MSKRVRQLLSLLYLPWVFFKERILRRGGVRILMFHSIANEHVLGIDNRNVVELPPLAFRRLIRYLVPRYRIISLVELVELLEHQIPLPAKTLVLTFDDGYANNYHEALPLLSEFDLRATIFVAAGFIGKPGYLEESMLAPLLARHIDLEGHTVNHPVLSQVKEEVAREEITRGKELLAQLSGKPVTIFAYPKGKLQHYSPRVVELVREAGFRAACTTLRGTNTLKTPLFELRRIGIDGSDSFFNFWLKLHGGYDWTGTLSRLRAGRKR